MKHSFSVFIALLMLLMAAPAVHAQKNKNIKGEGDLVTQERNSGTFNEVYTHGSFNVEITDGATNSVKVEAQQNLQEYIEVETSGNELHIRNKRGYQIKTDKDVTIHITAPALKAINLSGSGNIKGTNKLDGSDKFVIKSAGSGNISLDVETSNLESSIAGSGNITLKGSTNEFEGKIAGSGNIRAKELQSANTSVHISGSGSAEVVATQKLNTNIAGSGDVKYWGDASVDSKVRGSGSVHRGK